MKVREFLNILDDCTLNVYIEETMILSICGTDTFKKMPEIEDIKDNGLEDDEKVDLEITFGNPSDDDEWTFEQAKENWEKLMEAEVVHVGPGEDLDIDIVL